MQTISKTSTDTTINNKTKKYTAEWVFVVQQHNGTYIIGTANNPSKRICAINSGMNPMIKQSMTINRIVGVKEQTEERSLISVANKFIDQFGTGKVIVV